MNLYDFILSEKDSIVSQMQVLYKNLTYVKCELILYKALGMKYEEISKIIKVKEKTLQYYVREFNLITQGQGKEEIPLLKFIPVKPIWAIK